MSARPANVAAMSAVDAPQIVAAYWAAVAARDWAALDALLAEDVRYEVPQTP